MKLSDYINKCLENREFSHYWNSDDIQVEDINNVSYDNLWERLNSVADDELLNIIKDKGLKSNIDIPTTIEFYETNTSCPVEEFLNSITDQKLKTKTLKSIVALAAQGNNARPPLSKHIDDGIFELKTQQSSNITRIFYFFIFGNKIILTNGYIKKSQDLDKREFKKAKQYRSDYLSTSYT